MGQNVPPDCQIVHYEGAIPPSDVAMGLSIATVAFQPTVKCLQLSCICRPT